MRPAQPQPRRRGFTLLEMATATLLAAMAMTLTVQMLAWSGIERRAVGRRERALQEAANLMERFTALPYRAVTEQKAKTLSLSSEALDALPAAALEMKVTSESTEPAAKRVQIEIRWNGRSGEREAPVRLSAWVYDRPQEQNP
jgi:prepilin-type N-terminal cleavage/methylation domain-containing protein